MQFGESSGEKTEGEQQTQATVELQNFLRQLVFVICVFSSF